MASALSLLPRRAKSYSAFVALNTGGESDMQIVCKGRTWHVHRAMMCNASTFFQKALRFPVRREKEDKIVSLPEEDPEMVRRMVVFVYGEDYDPTGHLECGIIRMIDLASSTPTVISSLDRVGAPFHDPSCACKNPTEIDESAGIDTTLGPVHHCVTPLSTHAEMFALGDRYDVAGLCECAAEKFRRCLRAEHFDEGDFVTAVQIVFNETPPARRELRDLVVECFRTHFLCDLAEHPHIEETLPDFNNSALAFLYAFRDSKSAAEDSA